jgi:hypothetical protein
VVVGMGGLYEGGTVRVLNNRATLVWYNTKWSIKSGENKVYKSDAHKLQASSMTGTMKIEDRRLAEVDSNGKVLGIWDNANQLYKDESAKVSASQGDAISGKIFAALRRGERSPLVTLRDGRLFAYAASVGA